MTNDYPERLAFADEAFVEAADLIEEQLHHLRRRWQHNLALHSWGILAGLNVTCEQGDTSKDSQPKIYVEPGMALDGYGRELILTQRTDARKPQQLLDPASSYDVWMSYRANPKSSPGSTDACNIADELIRYDETPELRLELTSARQSPSPAEPNDVPRDDLEFGPERASVFEQARRWPVFLGRIEFHSPNWIGNDTERRYGGLIAEHVEFPVHASSQPNPQSGEPLLGRTVILNGGHPNFPDYRFAVLTVPADETHSPITMTPENVYAPLSVREVASQKSPATTKEEPPATKPENIDGTPAEKPAPVMEMEIQLRADRVVAEGDLVLQNGAGVQFLPNTPFVTNSDAAQGNASKTPKPPLPNGWAMYRYFDVLPNSSEKTQTAAQNGNQDSTTPIDPDVTLTDELRINMPAGGTGSKPQRSRIAMGNIDASGEFRPILTVNNDRSVVIHGRLEVSVIERGKVIDVGLRFLPNFVDDFKKQFRDALSSNPNQTWGIIPSVVQIAAEVATPNRVLDFVKGLTEATTTDKRIYASVIDKVTEAVPTSDTAFYKERIKTIADLVPKDLIVDGLKLSTQNIVGIYTAIDHDVPNVIAPSGNPAFYQKQVSRAADNHPTVDVVAGINGTTIAGNAGKVYATIAPQLWTANAGTEAAKALAKNVPNQSTDDQLKAFADELVKDPDRAAALLQAIADAIPLRYADGNTPQAERERLSTMASKFGTALWESTTQGQRALWGICEAWGDLRPGSWIAIHLSVV